MCQPDSMQPGGRRRKKVIAVVGGLLLALVVAVVPSCWFFGVHSRQDLRAYAAMSDERFHPIWKDLAWRRIGKGDSVEGLLRKHPPVWREDFGPYTKLFYMEPGSFNTLAVVAKNGTLIQARAGSCTWQHIFFASPDEEKVFGPAYTQYLQQRILEGHAYRLHRTITSGQDVFLSRRIERREVRMDPNESGYSADMLEQLRSIYGAEYIDQFMGTRLELTVEVNEVLSGDLRPGTVLKFRGDKCEDADLNGPETVFLHVQDSRMLWSHSLGGEAYATVPRKALDWYRSLTPEEVKQLEALRQSKSTATVK